jgi:ankyrin repeat protein
LKKRGVNCLEADGLGRSALHYAVGGGQKELVEMLLDQGADPRVVDIHGDTPLTLYLKGSKACKAVRLYNTVLGIYDPIFELLAKHGADMNTVYTEHSFKPDHKPLKVYKCTLLLNFIRHLAHTVIDEDNSFLRSGLLGLMHFGATLDIADNNYRDAMTYAISANNQPLVEFLITNREKCKLNVKFIDYNKRNAVHYLVNPCEFGSYENTEILDVLYQSGYEIDLKDD